MKIYNNRRAFLRSAALAGLGLGLSVKTGFAFPGQRKVAEGKRVGIIGLDTSHSIEFVKQLNSINSDFDYNGYKVIAAYPFGSMNIESSSKRIAGYTEDVKKLGVKITDSINELLDQVDVVLLETNDGHPHFKQAIQVLKAGKRMFIDKPVAASLKETIQIYRAAEFYKVPIFSASSLRYMQKAQEVAAGKMGKVWGADTYSPAPLEKTHTDLFWYGIHGVELLFTVMGSGCKTVTRYHTDDMDVVVGTWNDNRIGTFRGTRKGPHEYGGTIFTEKYNFPLGKYDGYTPLLNEIIRFFQSGIPPVTPEQTLEIYAFMQAADESKKRGGHPVTLSSVMKKYS